MKTTPARQMPITGRAEGSGVDVAEAVLQLPFVPTSAGGLNADQVPSVLTEEISGIRGPATISGANGSFNTPSMAMLAEADAAPMVTAIARTVRFLKKVNNLLPLWIYHSCATTESSCHH
jgi:hypothetical protein